MYLLLRYPLFPEYSLLCPTSRETKSSVRGGRGGTKKPNEKPSTSSEGGSQIYEPLPSTTTSSDNKIMKGVCPLCNEQFFQDELENHASTCCETVVISSNITTRKRATVSQLITCEACDEVLTLTTDYEVHVKECIERIKKK